MKNQRRPDLTAKEIQEPYAEFYNRRPATIPSDIIDDIINSPYSSKDALLFENINDLLNPGYLPLETGYCQIQDGSVFVAVLTERLSKMAYRETPLSTHSSIQNSPEKSSCRKKWDSAWQCTARRNTITWQRYFLNYIKHMQQFNKALHVCEHFKDGWDTAIGP